VNRNAIVIGAGHNGLVAANYLADAGYAVTVVEANERIGGMTACHTPIEGAPEHLINSYSVDAFFWDSFPPSRELGLERHGLRRTVIDPGHMYLGPDGSSIGFWADAARTAEEIRHFSPADARSYLEFAEMLSGFADLAFTLATANPTHLGVRAIARLARGAGRSRRNLSSMVAMALSSVTEVVDERFEHPVVKDALHATCGSTVPNSQAGTGIAFLWLATMHRHACARPVGGVQAIPDALYRRLLLGGGQVLAGTPVERILVETGAATGVLLTDGRELRADTVLAACDPRTTFEKLLPTNAVDDLTARRVRAIPVTNMGIGQAKVDLALRGKITMKRHQDARRDDVDVRLPSHTIGTQEGIERTFRRSAAGLDPLVGEFSLWPVIPTAADPSQAPAGQDTLYLYVAVAPYGIADYSAFADAVVATAADYYDGIEDLEIGRQVLGNAEVARDVHSSGGNITHVDMSLGRVGPLRPAKGLGGYRTPIEGLYLSGAGTHPGGGITGGPGYNAAREILRGRR
jgi:phytoene dehydrogenase-like protein